MKVEIKYRDGPARYGILEINEKKVEIPNIMFVSTKLSKPPDYASIVGSLNPKDNKEIVQAQPLGNKIFQYKINKNADFTIPAIFTYPASMTSYFHQSDISDEKHWCIVSGNKEGHIYINNRNAKIFTLANAPYLFPKSEIFLKNIILLREKIGYGSLLHLPAVANPSNLSLLVYLGIDIVDSISLVLAARRGFYLFPDGYYHKNEIPENLCSCPACRSSKDNRILRHNYNMMIQEMIRVKHAIKTGKLREHVEKRILISPHLVEKFRILHSRYYNYLEKRAAITKNSALIAVYRNAIEYPEVVRFRRRVIERYRKPKNTRILLLLPCSSKKPYSFSKSHNLFRRALLSAGNHGVVHEVIVTSPLGVVPRELEIVYPANSYDIPITGQWYAEEKEMIKYILRKYIKINSYDVIISHLPEALNDIVQEVPPDVIYTNYDHPTSQKSLENLSRTLKEYTGKYERIRKQRFKETLRCIAQYQFGRDIAEEIIPDGCKVEGRYPALRAIVNGKQIASLSEKRGLLSLTIEGGKILVSKKRCLVKVDRNVKVKGSILAVGIDDADADIRVGDEVVILKEDNLYAVGVARMNGEEMVDATRGEAVRVRHHL